MRGTAPPQQSDSSNATTTGDATAPVGVVFTVRRLLLIVLAAGVMAAVLRDGTAIGNGTMAVGDRGSTMHAGDPSSTKRLARVAVDDLSAEDALTSAAVARPTENDASLSAVAARNGEAVRHVYSMERGEHEVVAGKTSLAGGIAEAKQLAGNSRRVAASRCRHPPRPPKYPLDNGRHGWVNPTRRPGDSRDTCPDVRRAVETAYSTHRSGLGEQLRKGPLYSMPWFYHDPHPLCGALFLRHFAGAVRHAFVVRIDANVSSHSLSEARRTGGLTLDGDDCLARLPAGVDDTQVDRSMMASSSASPPELIRVTLGEKVDAAVFLEDCGLCGLVDEITSANLPACFYDDILVTARLVGDNGFQRVHVGKPVPAAHGGGLRRPLIFTPHLEGLFALEVKVVHVNGSSDNPTVPRSLGVIGIRASDENGRKAYRYNSLCDAQRHAHGSPVIVVVERRRTFDQSSMADAETKRPSNAATPPSDVDLAGVAPTTNGKMVMPPLCQRADHQEGRWVRVTTPTMCSSLMSSPYCYGSPVWLTDACAYNTDMLWAPLDCRFQFFTPPSGPISSCLKHSTTTGALLIVGDSVMREYAKSCAQFHLRGAKLVCVFANIALEGQHYSRDYSKAVVDAIIKNVISNNAAVFSTNLGIHHMIGPCTTTQWTEFIDLFVEAWKSSVRWSASLRRNDDHRDDNGAAVAAVSNVSSGARLEKAVWISPPTIHYARKGMGAQRAALWDAIAWSRLRPLGFVRLDAMAVTASRQEATWDGLHYASERNKVQTEWRNRHVRPSTWNGGVASMLFTMLLNLICNNG